MKILSRTSLLAIAVFATTGIALLAYTSSRASQTILPPDAGGSPAPDVSSARPLVSRTESIEVDRPLPVVLKVAAKPLESAVRGAGSLPGVVRTSMLTPGEFGAPGSRRLVHLSDTSTLVEEVLAREQSEQTFLFRYVVWNFQGPSAGKVDFGVGEFYYEALPRDRTRIRWTYSFKLNSRTFPGVLGPVGRFFFRVGFFERSFADMMRGVLRGYKDGAEATDLPATGSSAAR